MDEPDDSHPYSDPPELYAAHLVTCRSYWYDHRRPEAGISLAGILIHIEPPEGSSFPLIIDRVCIYFQLWGTVCEYRLRIRLVRVAAADGEEDLEIQLGPDGSPREFPMPTNRPAEIDGINYKNDFAFPIFKVPFAESGVYEFQLWADGIDQPIACESILARE